jgi:hypothetical protein
LPDSISDFEFRIIGTKASSVSPPALFPVMDQYVEHLCKTNDLSEVYGYKELLAKVVIALGFNKDPIGADVVVDEGIERFPGFMRSAEFGYAAKLIQVGGRVHIT